MDKLKEFIEFLNDEELNSLKQSINVDWVRDGMEKAMSLEAAKETVRLVNHYYVGLDRMYIITNEQQKRWHEIRSKAIELGITND